MASWLLQFAHCGPRFVPSFSQPTKQTGRELFLTLWAATLNVESWFNEPILLNSAWSNFIYFLSLFFIFSIYTHTCSWFSDCINCKTQVLLEFNVWVTCFTSPLEVSWDLSLVIGLEAEGWWGESWGYSASFCMTAASGEAITVSLSSTGLIPRPTWKDRYCYGWRGWLHWEWGSFPTGKNSSEFRGSMSPAS